MQVLESAVRLDTHQAGHPVVPWCTKPSGDCQAVARRGRAQRQEEALLVRRDVAWGGVHVAGLDNRGAEAGTWSR